MNYRGFQINESQGHGKTGKGLKKTATIRVEDHSIKSGYLIKKQFRFKVGHTESRMRARQKAFLWVEGFHLKKMYYDCYELDLDSLKSEDDFSLAVYKMFREENLLEVNEQIDPLFLKNLAYLFRLFKGIKSST